MSTPTGATDILSKPPHWFTRWGMYLLLVWIVIILLLAWLIQYPDTLEAPTRCVSTQPISEIRARMSGNLSKVRFTSWQKVEMGDQLGIIGADLSLQELQVLKNWIAQLKEDPFAGDVPTLDSLGPLSTAFGACRKSTLALRHEYERTDYAQRLALLQERLAEVNRRTQQFYKTAELQQHAVELKAAQFERSKQLFGSGAIGEIELENSEEAYLLALQERARIKQDSILLIEGTLAIKDEQISVLTERDEKFSALRMELGQIATQLDGQINNWEYQHVLQAPIAGSMEWIQSWTSGQWIEEGERFALLKGGTEDSTNIQFEVFLPANKAGKVQLKAPVSIRLEEFPYTEYGVLEGAVSFRSEVPVDGFYRLLVRLDYRTNETVLTSYQKQLHLNPGLSGMARVRMDRKRLLERIFEQLTALVRQD
ncbi:MAG: hypothetical protein AAGH79_02690 [Bacteroidota bacterium]